MKRRSEEGGEGLLDMLAGTPSTRLDTALTVTNVQASSSSSNSSSSNSSSNNSSSSSSGKSGSNSGRRKWTQQEDTFIRNAVAADGEWGWVKMAEHLNRTGDQCMYRWRRVLDPTIKKRLKWTKEEDAQLLSIRSAHLDWGDKMVASMMPNRTPTQVHNRWWCKVNPVLRWGEWSAEEDRVVVEGRNSGLAWVAIAERNPCLRNRALIALRNRWDKLNRRRKREEKKRRNSFKSSANDMKL